MAKSSLFTVFILAMALQVMLLCSAGSTATLADDEKDCADQLQSLAACIPYVSGTAKKPTPECCADTESGTAKKPTPECCADTERVRSSKPKCLCVLILESTDTSMALPINTTLALQMPAACNSDAKVSDCPTILKLSPGSLDAKIFKATAPASSPTAASAGGSSSKVAAANNAGRRESFTSGVLALMFSVALIFV